MVQRNIYVLETRLLKNLLAGFALRLTSVLANSARP